MRHYDFMNKEEQITDRSDIFVADESSEIKSFDHTKIPRSKTFTESMKYFDIEDDMTRNILFSVNEADQNTIMVSLANKLYSHIVDKVDDIDFGTIPLSKGDITKIERYDQLTDCIAIIAQILEQYHQDTKPIETVATALQNVIDRTDMFTKAYRFNIEMPIVAYNTIVLSIVSSVSYMISGCIEFVKNSNSQGFEISLNKVGLSKTKERMLFKQLEKFNKMCSSREFDNTMAHVMSENLKRESGIVSEGIGTFLLGAAAAVGAVIAFVLLLRELIFIAFYACQKASDYFDTNSTLLQMNAYNIENNLTMDEKQKKEISSKQRKIADKFKKLSNALNVKARMAEAKAEKELKKLDGEKYKYTDIMNSIPDSANAVLF